MLYTKTTASLRKTGSTSILILGNDIYFKGEWVVAQVVFNRAQYPTVVCSPPTTANNGESVVAVQ